MKMMLFVKHNSVVKMHVFLIKDYKYKHSFLLSFQRSLWFRVLHSSRGTTSLLTHDTILTSHYDTSQAIVWNSTCRSTGSNSGPWRENQACYPYTTAPQICCLSPQNTVRWAGMRSSPWVQSSRSTSSASSAPLTRRCRGSLRWRRSSSSSWRE